MTDEYEQYEIDCARIRKSNQKLLAAFAAWLQQSGLKKKTIDNHVGNVDFYINEYLLYEDSVDPDAGIAYIGGFLGYWFISKATWASPASIRSNAASLKKFYAFMHARGLVSKEDLDELKATIKEEMPEWVATVDRYDNPEIDDMGEVWGF